ncbi:MAG: peptidoglycan DD-metalloendopeptidase family protein [Lishizhenia sp.]
MKVTSFLFAFVFSFCFISLGQNPIDTLETEDGTILFYANRTWEYLEDRDFDGILNETVYSHFCEDSTISFVQTWDNDVCYTSNLSNDLQKLKDTAWLCVLDEKYNNFKMPSPGKVTSRYGYRRGRYHNGIDIDLVTGDTVRAAFSGKIRYAKYNESGFGNLVIIRHYNGLETFYAHLDKHLTVPNQWVEAGQPIGLGGNTGRSSGSHLHFETRFFDAPLNPEEIIDFKKGKVRSENLFVHKGLFRPGAAPSHAPKSSSSTANSASKYYKIRSGDTLGHIAAKHRTTVSRLCKLNGIRPTTTLRIGKTLRVR